MSEPTRIIDHRNPNWLSTAGDWQRWRLTYEGGQNFTRRYLKKFTTREDDNDFNDRLEVTPVPSFAKAAVNDIRNALFSRMRDITRCGGSQNYQAAIAGLKGGVDQRGSTMNAFLGVKVLTELLVMGKVGVYVDAPQLDGVPTLSQARGVRPYLYSYQVEDVLSYSYMSEYQPAEFKALLLRDTVLEYDENTALPLRTITRYRRFWLEDGRVIVQYYDDANKEIDNPVRLELERIPFVLLDIGDSLLKDVCQHQIALLNLGSSDINYALKANFPFYVEQVDPRGTGVHLKPAATTGTATAGGQGAADRDVRVGATHGQKYPLGANQPAFINPSSEPLQASMNLQENLKNDIRSLVNLAVRTLATRQSAESKSIDNQGLEAGLSYIGLVLENAERKITEYWAAYEERNEAKQQVATIKYPDRYSLKTDDDRIKESNELSSLMQKVPGQTVKREIAKNIVQSLLSGKVSVETIAQINREIDETPYTTSDPDTILSAVEKGLCGEQTGSLALGFNADEYKQAREDHAARVARIAEAQGISRGAGDPAARGAADLSADPGAGKRERAAATDTTLEDTTEKKQRGAGKGSTTEGE